MRPRIYARASAVLVVGLIATACVSSPGSDRAATTTTPAAAADATPTTRVTPGKDLQALIPIPADSDRTDGPDWITAYGVHMHFAVNGAPSDVMDAYKNALEGTGWSVTVENSGGGGGGGGATYTGTHGGAYGVFTGGGYGGTTDIDACVWPSKPSSTDCGDDR